MPELTQLFGKVQAIVDRKREAEKECQEREEEERLRLCAELDEERALWQRCPIMKISPPSDLCDSVLEFTAGPEVYVWQRWVKTHSHSFMKCSDPVNIQRRYYGWLRIAFEEWRDAAIAEMERMIAEEKR